MILGANIIKERIRTESGRTITKNGAVIYRPLIEGLSESQIEGIEGTTVDLRLDKVFKTLGGAQLLVDKRVTPRIEEIEPINDSYFIISPGKFYLVQTIETINLATNLLADVKTRSTLFRCGLYLKSTYVSPNYCGRLTFGIKNESDHPVTIQKGFRIAVISFMEIRGRAVCYNGIWGGDKVSTNGKEERPF